MSVLEAVERDLEEIRRADERLAGSALAATALALAREIDGHNSATSKSMCARSLLDVMDRLRELAPERVEVSRVDELRRQRERRLGGSAAS